LDSRTIFCATSLTSLLTKAHISDCTDYTRCLHRRHSPNAFAIIQEQLHQFYTNFTPILHHGAHLSFVSNASFHFTKRDRTYFFIRHQCAI